MCAFVECTKITACLSCTHVYNFRSIAASIFAQSTKQLALRRNGSYAATNMCYSATGFNSYITEPCVRHKERVNSRDLCVYITAI